jgi:cyclopropane-fatty-acyl-phospholipid synthase
MSATVTRTAPAEAVGRLHARLRDHGFDLPVRLWDGRLLGPVPAPFRLHLKRPSSLRAMLLPPDDLSAGEAYLHDDIDVEGSMVAAMRTVAAVRAADLGLRERLSTARDLLALPRPEERDRHGVAATLTGRLHSTARDRQAVQHHYDVGNDFYELVLDDELVYSCAYFDRDDLAAPPGDRRALTRAQVRKLDLVCRKLRLRPDERFLDIGCGWGSLVLHAARHHGARAVGITLSEQQAARARERVAAAGLADRIEIRLQDEREVSGTYDAIASVGMVEHVGPRRLAGYFTHLRELLVDGGRLLNHGITTGRRDRVRDLAKTRRSFVRTYVFPDGGLVPAHHTIAEVQRAGFELIDVEQLRPHYARTLEHWVANLEGSADRARASAGEVRYRIWRAYMAGSVVGFRSGDLGVVQVLAVVPGTSLPPGRVWMMPTLPG